MAAALCCECGLISCRPGEAVCVECDPSIGGMTTTTVGGMALDDDTARDITRAAKKAAEWTTKRNDLIRAAVASGGGIREVARAAGLNHATVLNIVTPKKRS